MRFIALYILVIAGALQLLANDPYNIEKRLHRLDSITSSHLSLAEQSGLLIDPPMELTTYFQELNQICPLLLDSIPIYAKFIADYCTRNPNTFAEALLNFQEVDSYVSTISYIINARNLIQWPLKQYLFKAFHPNDNFRLLLRKYENRNKLNNKLKDLLDTLAMQSRITLREKDLFNKSLAYDAVNYSNKSLTQEDFIWLSIGDTIVYQKQISEEQFCYNLIHNGAICKYCIYSCRNRNEIQMVVDNFQCSEMRDSLYYNYFRYDLTDYQLLDCIIGILHHELFANYIIAEKMNLIIRFPDTFDDIKLLRDMFFRNGLHVNKITTDKNGKSIEAMISSQFRIKAEGYKKNIFTFRNEEDAIRIEAD